MGVGAKMAKGAVGRSRSLLSGTSTRRTPWALLAGGGGCCFSPPDAPHGVRKLLVFPAVSHSGLRLDRAEGLWARTWPGEGGSGLW